MLVEGGAEGDLGPHRQEGAEGDDAQADADEQTVLPTSMFVVGRREQLHPASAGYAVSVGAGAGAPEWTGTVGELQSRSGVDGSFAG